MSGDRGWKPHPEGRANPLNRGDLAEPSQSHRVVGIGAICDFRTGGPEPGPSQSFSVDEFVALEDGRQVVIDRRGLTLEANVGSVRQGLTQQIMRRQVLNVVLPDDDACDDEHPWPWLAELAQKHGLDVTADELKELPYEVVLTDRLTRWLTTS